VERNKKTAISSRRKFGGGLRPEGRKISSKKERDSHWSAERERYPPTGVKEGDQGGMGVSRSPLLNLEPQVTGRIET